MRKIPHAVAVITACHSESHKSSGVTVATMDTDPPLQQGLVVSSFNTVTFTPEPIVSFNIKIPSRTYDAISECGYFDISPVHDANVADAFLYPLGNNVAEKELEKTLPRASELRSARLFGLRCRWLRMKSITVGDHVIMVGQVVKVLEQTQDTRGRGVLLWGYASYHRISPARKEQEEHAVVRRVQQNKYRPPKQGKVRTRKSFVGDRQSGSSRPDAQDEAKDSRAVQS